MQLESLKELYKSMKAQSLDVQKFMLKLNVVTFDCLFSTRELPFVLTLTSRGRGPKFLKFEVQNSFVVADYMDGVAYRDLAIVLKIDGRSGKPLVPKDFFAQIDSMIPRTASINWVPSCGEIIRLRHDITEDRDKPYFDGWIYWSEESKKSPTQENRKKTYILLGLEAYNHSKQYNASSSWTAEPRAKNWKDEIKKTR